MDTEQGVLISGASGFVGSYLTLYFNQREYSIVPLSRRGKFSYASLDDKANIDVTTYIHLAGKSSDDDTLGEDLFWKANVNPTVRLFTHFLLNKEAKCFIFMSSIKAFDHKIGGVLTEDNLGQASGYYGASKRAAEEKIVELYTRYLTEGGKEKSVVILRPCLIHGPNNKGNLHSLYRLVEKGIPYPFAAYNTIRSYLHVENLAFIVQRIIELKPKGVHRWLISDDEPIATSEVLNLASKVLGKRAVLFQVPKWFWRSGFFLMGIVNNRFNMRLLHKITDGTVVSNARVKKELRIVSLPLKSREGLIATFGSFANKE